jgi:hypothetical protein
MGWIAQQNSQKIAKNLDFFKRFKKNLENWFMLCFHFLMFGSKNKKTCVPQLKKTE